ncbi:MAG: hypothetical protein R8K22_02535 [Mariprofundaceae bacterium]
MLRYFLLLILFFPIQVYAQNISVISEGYGASRNESLYDMKRNAVEQGLGVFLSSKTLSRDFVVEKDKILTHAEGFVKQISIISEEKKTNPSLWYIKAKVMVSSDSIKDEMIALKMLLHDVEMPRLVILMHEKVNGKEIVEFSTSEASMIKILRAKRFHLLDSDQIKKVRGHDMAMALYNEDQKVSMLIAAQLDADFMIVGEAKCQSLSVIAGSRILTNQAQVNIKVLNGRTGVLISAESAAGRSAHISGDVGCAQAITNSVDQVLDGYLIDQLIMGMMDEQNNGMLIRLKVTSGLNSFSRYKKVKGILESIQKVVSVNKRLWNKKAGFAEFDVVYKGKVEGLADKLELVQIKGDDLGHPLQVSDLTRSEIEVEYVKK